jgi:hypothetical protein
MPYINDVFISYKRGKINEQWLNEIFLPLFTDYLSNELPFDPKIFVDTNDLTPGVFFNEELFINLLYSKCLVSIWSPPYFNKSIWCVMEFLTMKHRQELLKLTPLTKPKSLICSIMYREVSPIPDIAEGITYMNYTDFNLVGDAFFKTEKYLGFQQKLQKDIKIIGEIIKNAPALNPVWETPGGRKQIEEELISYFAKHNLSTDQKQQPISWQIKS